MNSYKSKLEEWYDSTAERYDSWGLEMGSIHHKANLWK